MRTVTVDEVLSWNPCPKYDRAALLKLAGRKRKMTALQILALKIPQEDRFWAILKHGFLSDKVLRHFACDCAERVLPLFEKEFPEDKRPRQAIEMSRRFADGFATVEELDAARAAAWAAAWAAGDARDARDKEQAWQVKRLRKSLEEKP